MILISLAARYHQHDVDRPNFFGGNSHYRWLWCYRSVDVVRALGVRSCANFCSLKIIVLHRSIISCTSATGFGGVNTFQLLLKGAGMRSKSAVSGTTPVFSHS